MSASGSFPSSCYWHSMTLVCFGFGMHRVYCSVFCSCSVVYEFLFFSQIVWNHVSLYKNFWYNFTPIIKQEEDINSFTPWNSLLSNSLHWKNTKQTEQIRTSYLFYILISWGWRTSAHYSWLKIPVVFPQCSAVHRASSSCPNQVLWQVRGLIVLP